MALNTSIHNIRGSLPDSVTLSTRVADPYLSNLEIEAQKVQVISEDVFLYAYYKLVTVGFLQEVLGDVKIQIQKENDYISIESLDNRSYCKDTGRSIIKRVGSAGLELAVRISHFVGRSGNIQLHAANDASFFYYTWGFRFVPKPKDIVTDAILSELSAVNAAYPLTDQVESEMKIEGQSWLSKNELTLFTELGLETDLENLDEIMDLLIKHKKTPREGVPIPICFRSKMYLPPDAIIEKRRQYSLL